MNENYLKEDLLRPSKFKYYLNIAEEVSRRSTCIRRQYGAIIVNNDEIIASGYNGAPRGCVNCYALGTCYRQENNIPQGSMYEKCEGVHAEMNCIISASRKDMLGSTLFLFGCNATDRAKIEAVPCEICSKLIVNAGISTVITLDSLYKVRDGKLTKLYC